MRTNWYRIFPLVVAMAFSPAKADSQFSVQGYIESIKRFHPKLQEAAAKRAEAEYEEMAALGEFDPVVSQNTYLRPSGYYDGQYLDQKVSQRLRNNGIKVFGGYRISDGQFPTYESVRSTLRGGEVNMGVAMPILRDRATDKYRTELENALAEREHWQARELATINATLQKGMEALLDWYQAGLRRDIMKELVETTVQRLDGIKTRVANGDLAKISLTEFNATLMSRKLALLQAEQNLAQARQELVFYWRDENGQMMSTKALPDRLVTLDWPYRLDASRIAQLHQSLPSHPVISALQAEMNKARNNERLKENGLLPQLDLELKLARDLGSGSETLQGTEGLVGLQFSMPLGMRTAKAERFQATEKVKALDFALNNLYDELKRDIASALAVYHYGKDILELNKQQADLADQLLNQEFTRFRAGASDLFLLNNREALSIQARLTAVSAKVKLLESELAVWAVAGQLSQ